MCDRIQEMLTKRKIKQGIYGHQTPPEYCSVASGSRLKVQPSTYCHTAHYGPNMTSSINRKYITYHNTTDSNLFKRLLKSHLYNRSFDITARMTYTVSSGTLNPTQLNSIDSAICYWTILFCILAYTK